MELVLAGADERDDLGAFVARAVRLDQATLVRLRTRSVEQIEVWAATPFDVLATRTAAGHVTPADITVNGTELLAGIAVSRQERIDPGTPKDLLWRGALPPSDGWSLVDELPVEVLSELADEGVKVAKENAGPKGTPPASLLDQSVLTVSGSGYSVKVPMRCLFALSGMGFLGGTPIPGDRVKVSATDSWLRIDARFGAVVRRRHSLLPLLV
ncbi:hypothetical protein D5S17_22305 [Pseudonocardiaceae bacterium YIM PH 21723]|nr:hypothetical protein D5S17_22305 [Pseudonocardiaceae bacterium YIM PH 21723]